MRNKGRVTELDDSDDFGTVDQPLELWHDDAHKGLTIVSVLGGQAMAPGTAWTNESLIRHGQHKGEDTMAGKREPYISNDLGALRVSDEGKPLVWTVIDCLDDSLGQAVAAATHGVRVVGLGSGVDKVVGGGMGNRSRKPLAHLPQGPSMLWDIRRPDRDHADALDARDARVVNVVSERQSEGQREEQEQY